MSAVENNLGCKILQDGSTVDSRSAPNPPQTILIFHLYRTVKATVQMFRQNYILDREYKTTHRAVFLAHSLAVAEHGHLLQLAMDPEFSI